MDLRKVPCINIFYFYSKCHTSYIWFFHHILKFIHIWFVLQFDPHKQHFCGVQIRINFSYLQIDAMLKQLHINRGSGCSGLLLCNHLDLPISIIPYLPLGTLQTSLQGEALEAPTLLFFGEGSRFCKSSKKEVPDFDNPNKDKSCWWKSKSFHTPKWWFLNGPLSCVPLFAKLPAWFTWDNFNQVNTLWGVFTWLKYNITHCVWYVSILQPIR